MFSSTPEKAAKRVSISAGTGGELNESTPLNSNANEKSYAKKQSSSMDLDEEDEHSGEAYFSTLKGDSVRRESIAADQLSMRLLAIADDDSEAEDRILKETLQLSDDDDDGGGAGSGLDRSARSQSNASIRQPVAGRHLCGMISLFLLGSLLLMAALFLGVQFIGPPNQPVGPYQLVERQEGDEFFSYYNFYEGPDSAGSNGYINYVAKSRAEVIGIANITMEEDELDVFFRDSPRRRMKSKTKQEPFLYLSSAPTKEGPRESIRLEGKRRFNRGLFVIDVRHMPAGCGVWPAFWLTDEANWPVNGEIDIVEGVNYQSEAKTALHTTKGCDMYDVPLGTMTGSWDTAVGIPDAKTGIPDMTFRYAQNCFVYDRHQWLNQGCVAIDENGGSLGIPLNEKGGGIFVLEWDPINIHMRTWVFSPHTKVPENLVDSIRTASEPDEADRVMPLPDSWPLPYGYFPLGEGTNCPSSHFRNMRLVLNTAFCGSVAGNRYFLDCKNESKVYESCNEYIKSQPEALSEAYWKIRGVYVYERAWQKSWTGH